MLHEILKMIHMTAAAIFVLCAIIAFAMLIVTSGRDVESRRGILQKIRRFAVIPSDIALGVVWLLGIWMAISTGFWAAGWLWLKVAIVFAISGIHGAMSKRYRLLVGGEAVNLSSAAAMLAIFVVGAIAVVGLAFSKPF